MMSYSPFSHSLLCTFSAEKMRESCSSSLSASTTVERSESDFEFELNLWVVWAKKNIVPAIPPPPSPPRPNHPTPAQKLQGQKIADKLAVDLENGDTLATYGIQQKTHRHGPAWCCCCRPSLHRTESTRSLTASDAVSSPRKQTTAGAIPLTRSLDLVFARNDKGAAWPWRPH